MTVSASLQFTQGVTVGVAGQAFLATLGAGSVTIANGDNTDVQTWTFILLDCPTTSAFTPGTTLQTGTTPTFSFTGDVFGSYRIQLQVVGPTNTSVDTRDIIYKSTSRNWIYPAFLNTNAEMNYPNPTSSTPNLRGWMPALETILNDLETNTVFSGEAAGGDLSGTYPNPTVAKIHGVSVPASPSAGQILTATSSTTATWQTGSSPGGSAGGDLSGTYPNPTVSALQGNSVKVQTLGAGQDGYILTWVNADGMWEAQVAPAGFTAGGDLSGTPTNQNVINIHGASVPIAGSLVTGNVLQVSGVSALSYGPVNLAGGSNYVTGTLPVGNLPSLAGDVTGTITAAVVAKIQGNAVQSGALGSGQDGYVLTWVNGSSQWQAQPAASGFTAGGDLTGTSSSQNVVKIRGNPVSATAPTGGQFLVEDNGGGGSTWRSLTGDVTGSTSTPGQVTVNQARGLVTATTTVVVSAATAPTSGQVLTATSSTAANWQSVSASGGWTSGYDVDFTTLTTQNLITGGDGTKVLSDGSTWTVFGTGHASTFGITNGTGLVITKNTDSNQFLYMNALLSNLFSGPDFWGNDIEIWVRSTLSGGFTTGGSGCFWDFDLSSSSDLNPSNANYNLQRGGLEVAASAGVTPNKSCFEIINNGTLTRHNTVSVDSPIHDVFVVRGRGPGLWDMYTGTYSSGWPNENTLTYEGSCHWITDTTGRYFTVASMASNPLKGQNLSLHMSIGSTGTATPSTTITNLRCRYK